MFAFLTSAQAMPDAAGSGSLFLEPLDYLCLCHPDGWEGLWRWRAIGCLRHSSWDNRVEIKGERRGPRDPGKKDRQRGQATVGL